MMSQKVFFQLHSMYMSFAFNQLYNGLWIYYLNRSIDRMIMVVFLLYVVLATTAVMVQLLLVISIILDTSHLFVIQSVHLSLSMLVQLLRYAKNANLHPLRNPYFCIPKFMCLLYCLIFVVGITGNSILVSGGPASGLIKGF